ncbi:hypothetical protein [Paenibacillus sp. y28]
MGCWRHLLSGVLQETYGTGGSVDAGVVYLEKAISAIVFLAWI